MVIRMASAVVSKDNKILLLKRSKDVKTRKGAWQFPEGKIGLGEKAEEALVREVNEETSLSVKSHTLLSNVSNWSKIFGAPVYIKRNIYMVETKGEIELSDEHEEYGWFSVDKALALPLHYGMKEALKKLTPGSV